MLFKKLVCGYQKVQLRDIFYTGYLYENELGRFHN